MPGTADPGSLEFEKVSLNDARKALEETGPAAYAARRKPENWEEKRTQAPAEPLTDEANAWMAEMPDRFGRANWRCVTRGWPIGCARSGASR